MHILNLMNFVACDEKFYGFTEEKWRNFNFAASSSRAVHICNTQHLRIRKVPPTPISVACFQKAFDLIRCNNFAFDGLTAKNFPTIQALETILSPHLLFEQNKCVLIISGMFKFWLERHHQCGKTSQITNYFLAITFIGFQHGTSKWHNSSAIISKKWATL